MRHALSCAGRARFGAAPAAGGADTPLDMEVLPSHECGGSPGPYAMASTTGVLNEGEADGAVAASSEEMKSVDMDEADVLKSLADIIASESSHLVPVPPSSTDSTIFECGLQREVEGTSEVEPQSKIS